LTSIFSNMSNFAFLDLAKHTFSSEFPGSCNILQNLQTNSTVNNVILCVMTPFELVDGYQYFEGTPYLYTFTTVSIFRIQRWRQYVPLKC
jgi:hypothetical protein